MEQSKWIKVEDRLPSKNGEVLIYEPGIGARVVYFFEDTKVFRFNSEYKPSHWQPLPQPPKED